MKKQYIAPEMEVIKTQKTYLLAGSGVSNGSPLGDDYNSGDISY